MLLPTNVLKNVHVPYPRSFGYLDIRIKKINRKITNTHILTMILRSEDIYGTTIGNQICFCIDIRKIKVVCELLKKCHPLHYNCLHGVILYWLDVRADP